MSTATLHVVTHDENGWALKREGNSDPVSTHATQKEAITAAIDLAEDEENNVVVHRKDGRIREVMSYRDDGPPKNSNESAAGATVKETVYPLSSLGSRVRWGAIFGGFLVTVASSITLSALGAALGLCLSNVLSGDWMHVFAGVWVMLTLLGSLFVGGMIITRLTVGESEILEPSVYGVILWALMFCVLPILPLSAANVGFGSLNEAKQTVHSSITEENLLKAGLTKEQADTVTKMATPAGNLSSWVSGNATEAAWLSFVAIIVSLGAAVGGSVVGATLSEEHLMTQTVKA